jgi:glycosyltransferase involved in cell wall biosynthesis
MTHIRELTQGLAALGHSVKVINRRRKPAVSQLPPGTEEERPPAYRRWRTRLSPYLHETAAMARALRGIAVETSLIRREQPDVVLTRHSLHQFSSICASRRCGVPIVYEVNAPLAYEYRRYRSQYFLIPWFAEWLEVQMFSHADGLFVVSEVLRKYFLESGVPADRILVIPNGAEVDRFKPEAADQAVRLQMGEGNVVVGFVGSFASFHGIEQLRQAIDFACSRRKNVRFMLVGSGERSKKLKEHCVQMGFDKVVHFAGHVPPERVPGYMAAADILLAPYEAQDLFYFSPIKIFEYMAAGRAVLAASVGQIAEVIEDGTNGILYNPRDPESLGVGLDKLLDDPSLRRRLGENARQTVVGHYTWRANAERVEALLKEAVENQKARTS